jgi:hypothetical protein
MYGLISSGTIYPLHLPRLCNQGSLKKTIKIWAAKNLAPHRGPPDQKGKHQAEVSDVAKDQGNRTSIVQANV